jgi:hypothetical protein
MFFDSNLKLMGFDFLNLKKKNQNQQFFVFVTIDGSSEIKNKATVVMLEV